MSYIPKKLRGDALEECVVEVGIFSEDMGIAGDAFEEDGVDEIMDDCEVDGVNAGGATEDMCVAVDALEKDGVGVANVDGAHGMGDSDDVEDDLFSGASDMVEDVGLGSEAKCADEAVQSEKESD
eukprot:1162154-Pelagomonas_calceolata.AAC.6